MSHGKRASTHQGAALVSVGDSLHAINIAGVGDDFTGRKGCYSPRGTGQQEAGKSGKEAEAMPSNTCQPGHEGDTV